MLYYDCTNYYFETEEESGLRQYGYSKEHRPNPIVQMGLFTDMDGFPLAFCIKSRQYGRDSDAQAVGRETKKKLQSL